MLVAGRELRVDVANGAAARPVVAARRQRQGRKSKGGESPREGKGSRQKQREEEMNLE